jgi:hypothetical protein
MIAPMMGIGPTRSRRLTAAPEESARLAPFFAALAVREPLLTPEFASAPALALRGMTQSTGRGVSVAGASADADEGDPDVGRVSISCVLSSTCFLAGRARERPVRRSCRLSCSSKVLSAVSADVKES